MGTGLECLTLPEQGHSPRPCVHATVTRNVCCMFSCGFPVARPDRSLVLDLPALAHSRPAASLRELKSNTRTKACGTLKENEKKCFWMCLLQFFIALASKLDPSAMHYLSPFVQMFQSPRWLNREPCENWFGHSTLIWVLPKSFWNQGRLESCRECSRWDLVNRVTE